MKVPCGQCSGCRLERSRQWAVRIMHEAQMHDSSLFLTLTYDDDHVPSDGSLRKKDLQKFWKRLRKKVPGKIRYYAVGEYGDNTQRPHYHACVFNVDFEDKAPISVGATNLYNSSVLDSIWKQGFTTIGELTFDSAAYVARYCMKKVTGKKAHEHYQRIDPDTGEVYWIEPEFQVYSNKPGLGRSWYDKYYREVFPNDEVVINGKQVRPPRTYKTWLEQTDSETALKVQRARSKKKWANRKNNTTARLEAREQITEARLGLKERRL